MVVAYAGIVPPEAPVPTVEELEADWRRSFTSSTVLVGESDGQVVASVAVQLEDGQLRRLHVLPSSWGRGIGSHMHDEALRVMRECGLERAWLWVLEANARARHMYESRGWCLCPGRTLEWPGLRLIEVRYERELI